jgi:hypothetical protein
LYVGCQPGPSGYSSALCCPSEDGGAACPPIPVTSSIPPYGEFAECLNSASCSTCEFSDAFCCAVAPLTAPRGLATVSTMCQLQPCPGSQVCLNSSECLAGQACAPLPGTPLKVCAAVLDASANVAEAASPFEDATSETAPTVDGAGEQPDSGPLADASEGVDATANDL